MWERFSYYGMRALLVLYLVQAMGYSDADAGHLYGIYTSLVYMTPLFGGYLADRYLGYGRAILLGSVLMLLGHLSLALEGKGFFFAGLGLLILGNGFFKPNMSTFLGRLYDSKPELRNSGYAIFYMGINLGALLGPLLTGTLAKELGWHYGFGAAGVGMGCGILIYLRVHRKPMELHPNPSQPEESSFGDRETEKDSLSDRQKVQRILFLSLFSIFFWMAFEQMGSSLNLFAERNIDRIVGGFEIPTAWFQSVNPIFILLLAPLLSARWKGQSFRPFLGFAQALFFLGVGFLVLAFAVSWTPEGTKISLWYLVLAYFWNTLGELYLSPTGLSFVSSTAPKAYGSLLMGAWFLSNAVAHYLGGIFSGYLNQFSHPSHFFLFFVATSWTASLVLFWRSR